MNDPIELELGCKKFFFGSFSWHLMLKYLLPKYIDLIASFHRNAMIIDSAQIEFVIIKCFNNHLRT